MYLHNLFEDMSDLHVRLPHLHIKNFISVLHNYVRIWQAGGVCVHIGLELSLDLAGIWNIWVQLNGSPIWNLMLGHLAKANINGNVLLESQMLQGFLNWLTSNFPHIIKKFRFKTYFHELFWTGPVKPNCYLQCQILHLTGLQLDLFGLLISVDYVGWWAEMVKIFILPIKSQLIDWHCQLIDIVQSHTQYVQLNKTIT